MFSCGTKFLAAANKLVGAHAVLMQVGGDYCLLVILFQLLINSI